MITGTMIHMELQLDLYLADAEPCSSDHLDPMKALKAAHEARATLGQIVVQLFATLEES